MEVDNVEVESRSYLSEKLIVSGLKYGSSHRHRKEVDVYGLIPQEYNVFSFSSINQEMEQ